MIRAASFTVKVRGRWKGELFNLWAKEQFCDGRIRFQVPLVLGGGNDRTQRLGLR